jgi:hypothetical protein
MADPVELEGDAASARAQGDVEFREWAARQPLGFGLVDGQRVRLAEEHQGEARLALARAMAIRAFGAPEAADAWLATPTSDLGGLSPADLVTESDEGRRLALIALVRRQRLMLDAGDG